MSGLPFPSPGDLPDPGIEAGSLALQADSSLSHQWRQFLIAPKRMKQLGQSGNDTRLWMCLVVRVKPEESCREYVLICFELDPLSSLSLPNPEHHRQPLAAAAAPASATLYLFILPVAWARCLTHGILDKHSTTYLLWQPRASTREPETILPAVTAELYRQRLSARTLGSDIWHQALVFATHFLCILSLNLSAPWFPHLPNR